MDYNNFATAAEALAFMLRNKGTLRGMRCVSITIRHYRFRVFWNGYIRRV